MSILRPHHRVASAIAAVAALLCASFVTVPAATADTRPVDPALPVTVSADPLPTVQIDGVAWKQVIVGNTVYVAGDFKNARPAGAAAGTQLTPRANMLAYNLTTGELIPGFAPSFNAQVKDIAVSADGKRLFVVGNFTAVNGVARYRFAALDLPTGALSPGFPNGANAYITSVAATATTVYLGGTFTTLGTAARPRIGAVSATNGAVLPFTAPIDNNQVNDITVAPDGRSVVVSGNFTSVGGSANPGYGLARLDGATGAMMPLPVNDTARNAGLNASSLSLESDGEYFYGTGYNYAGGGNVEGSWAARWDTGELVWIEDCHGDTYSAFPIGDVIYQASHKHYCGNSGGFPQTEPWTFYNSTAVTKAVRGVNTADIYNYKDHPGTPRPEFLEWYPTWQPGTYTGKNQGPWTVTGNSDYVLYGGEFLRVNNGLQQGLTRFARPGLAPNKQGPVLKSAEFPLRALSFNPGEVRLSWKGNYDRDNATLTYSLYRGSTTVPPIDEQTVTAPFWNQPTLKFRDTQPAGSTQRYRVVARDAYGNEALSDWVTVNVAAAPPAGYAGAVLEDSPVNYWRLDEPSGTTVADWGSEVDALTRAGVTRGTAGALIGDPDAASTFSGTTTGAAISSATVPGPNVMTVEAWFRTTTTTGGKIVGFGNRSTGESTSYDRHVYMANDGRILFGANNGSLSTIASTGTYNDGQWHHVAATLGTNGIQLFMDGVRVAARPEVTRGQALNGVWRIGGDNLNGWASAPSSRYFAGQIDEVAVYGSVLSRADVQSHYVASGRAATVPPAPADAYGAAVHALDPALYWRFDETTGATVADAGGANLRANLNGTYTRGAPGALSGGVGSGLQLGGPSGGWGAASLAQQGPRVYSVESWFSTTSTTGGKIIGFGNSATAASTTYDRHVFMQNDGRLVFGVQTGASNTIVTARSYNDGRWHHVVGTQGPEGMRLYVDGELAGSNPQTGARAFNGYWRVGGDATGSTATSTANLLGTIDEAAVYDQALTPAQVAQHYALGTGGVPAPNAKPTAAFTDTVNGLSVSLDGAPSRDTDGRITSYAWSFGDGTTGTGATATHAYAAGGTYTVALTVTDDAGDTATTSRAVTVAAPNQAPTASFTVATDALSVTVNASGSTDADGTVAAYAWTFGDGTTGTGVTASRTYAAAGTYRVTLTVTDDDGATNVTLKDVVVAPAPLPNAAPTASFTSQASDLVVAFDGSASADTDGTIASYAWSFGDGTTGTGQRASRTYAAAGTYTVTLTVTDDGGRTGSVTRDVTVTAPPAPNAAPTASFTSQATDLAVAFDGSGSTDPDGTVATYAWSFGDGSTGTGQRTSHTYPAAGTYTATLTVTDDGGRTGTVERQVTVTAAPTPTPVTQLAADAFGRSLTSAWGTADRGGSWTLWGTAGNYGVANGVGSLRHAAGGGTKTQLASVAQRDVDVAGTFALDRIGTGGGTFVSLSARASGWNNDYRAKVWVKATGDAVLYLTRADGAETTLATTTTTGVRLVPGEALNVRLQATGASPTTLRAKVWKRGTLEPAGWQATATDSWANLQDAGAVGTVGFLSANSTATPVIVTVDDFAVEPVAP